MSHAVDIKTAWLAANIRINPGLLPREIRSFESANEIVLPGDFVEYLKVVNGMRDRDMDKDLYHFTPLSELNIWDGRYTFADWCIESSIFVLELSTDPPLDTPILRYRYDGGKQVAPNFTQFLRMYVGGANL